MKPQSTPAPTHRAAPLWLLVGLQGGISGASLVVEITAGRMIAPYVGMSLHTWTAIIAVVLAGFSAGHWIGGRIAERDGPRALRLAGWTMLAAAASAAAAPLLLRAAAGPALQGLADPLAAITALAAAAFFLPSLFAGIPAPVLSIAAMRGRAQAERALGAMYAAGAVGAIGGTMLAGFVFAPWLGAIGTLTAIGAFYAASGALLLLLGRPARRQALAAAAAGTAALGIAISALSLPPVCDRESSYFCIRTVELGEPDGPPLRLMALDHLAHGISAREAPRTMFTDHTAMLDALPRMRMGGADFSSFHIGGGSFSVPRAWADRGATRITVAEIDPEVSRTAVEDFWLDPAAVEILPRDARVALLGSDTRYDVIVGDAFTDISAPEHLVTQEFFQLVADRLTPGGVYAMNLIDNTARLDALAAVTATLGAVFPSVEIWTEARPPAPAERRIFVLLAGDGPSPVSAITAFAPDPKRFAALDPGFIDAILQSRAPRILTDDRAPIGLLVGLEPLID